MEGEPVYVRVLYHFDYTTKDTRMVSIRQGEKLELLKQTNPDWWQVRRDFNSKPFYVPAAYVREIPPPFISPLINPPPVKSNPYKDRNTKIVKNEFQTKHIQKVDYTNFQNIQPTTDTPRHTIEASLRKELIHGNFKLKPCENNNNNKKSSDKLQDNTSLSYQSRLGNLVKDIKVQQKVSFDNRGVGTSVSPPSSVSFQPSTQERVSRSYSVVTPIVPKKPVPCPRLKELSKSLETLAEEIQFTPSNNKNSSDSIWKNGETSDYHTPSPDYLDSDMFWKKSTSPQDDTNAASSSNVQRSSSFRFTRWPSRKKKRERKRAALGQTGDACSEDDSGASRSLESLVDSGAEACSSSSYEWDRSGEGSEGATTPKRVPPLAFRNFTYRSTDDDSDADEGARPRSVSDTAVNLQPNLQSSDSQSSPGDTVSSRSESHISDQPKPLVALKRNQKLVGCRRRPALLCIPSSSNNNNERSKSARRNKEVYLPRAPRCPPSPAPHEKPLRVLPGGWAEFYCSDAGGAGRIFYFHAITGERSWKPPRTRRSAGDGQPAEGEEGSAREDGSSTRSRSQSPAAETTPVPLVLPPGWEERYDDEAEQNCYFHKDSGAKWFSSSDREGRLYFFEENSNESSWTLPDDVDQPAPSTPTPTTPTNKGPDKTKRQTSAVSALVAAVDARQGSVAERRPLGPAFEAGSRSTIAATLLHAQHSDDEDDEDSRTSPHVRARLPPGALLLPAYQQLARGNKTRSMVIEAKRVPSDETVAKTASIPRNWPQLLEAGMAVLKEGVLHKTKITENGKKLRKNWAPSHVVLTELLLLFFRDAKSFQAMRSGNVTGSKPELCVDLNGAAVESADKLSSRKNVFVVSTALGLQVLCQEENVSAADSWFYQLGLAIKNLGGGCNTTPRIKLLPTSREPSPLQQEPSPEEVRAASIGRSRSVKIKKDMGSVEDLSASPTEQTKIKDRLKKFFVRRPTMESLVKKGIWKDEPAFGCYLGKLCMDESLQVPVFVQRCIAAIEGKPENLKTDGLYRASGNLSQVQKIRLQVDQNNLSVLDQEEDVHVLTGALKLFFRELKEPLIPFDAFNKALKASTNPNKKEKLQHFREIVRHLPGPNHDTLQFLLQHLLRVTEQQASNRMHIPNLAIVFGPTLMWPEQESLNMALDLMQQNIVIESLLLDYDNIFR